MKPQSPQKNKQQSLVLPSTKLPVLGICGPKGEGLTALIATLLPELLKRGLQIAVVQHRDHNRLVEQPDQDSDCLYQAGADLFLLDGSGSQECFLHGARRHSIAGAGLSYELRRLSRHYDLVLVAGDEQAPVPKIWLLADAESLPADTATVLRFFPPDETRSKQVLAFLLSWLQQLWAETPVWACVLIGGLSSRMGRPKHLLEKITTGTTWLENTVNLLQPLIGDHIALSGPGIVPDSLAHLPRLPDVPEARGPLTGILAAMRWQPTVSWLLIACDMPHINTEALAWLLDQRRPGCWGTVPRLQEDGYVEPLLAHYDYRCGPLFEQLLASGSLRIGQIAGQPKIEVPLIPRQLRSSWHNINTPQELAVSRQAEQLE